MKLERRAFTFEVRATNDEVRKVEGYAAVFNKLSEPLGYSGWRERIDPGAFTASLADSTRDIYGLWNHNCDIPLASRTEGTLTLTEDEVGLAFSMLLDDTTWGSDAYKAIRSKRVRKMSFGFEALTTDWKMIDGEEVRILQKLDLWEISPVVWPAYTDTTAEVRGALDDIFKRHLAETGAASKAETRGRIDVLMALNQSKRRRIA
jgi:uncharacterized protein